MESPYKVSVIIPTHNRSQLLSRAIKSALLQTHMNLEIIVVDDASTDDTKEVVSRFDDERIRYFRLAGDSGAGAARNAGITQSRGQFVGFLDDDDAWLPEKVEKQLVVFSNSGEDLGLVSCGQIKHDADNNTFRLLPRTRGNIFQLQLRYDHLPEPGVWLVRKSCFLDPDVGLFDETLPAREDYDIGIRITKKYRVDYVPECLAEVFIHGQNRLSDNEEKVLEGDLRILEKIEMQTRDFSAISRRSILSYQYYYIGLHLLTFLRATEGKTYLKRSLSEWPFNTRALVLILFLSFGDKELARYKACHRFLRDSEVAIRKRFAGIERVVR